MFSLSAAFVLASLIAGAAQAQSPRKIAGKPAPEFQRLLAAPLPGAAKPEGSATQYRPDTLYQYIDGGADIYLLYDFRELLHQDFKSGANDLTADVYDMGRPEDAFGIYAAERSLTYKFITVGIEGYRSKGILNFVQDRYYIKLSGSGASVDPLLIQIANTLSERMGGARTKPALLRGLPAEKRVAHSEQYVRKDPLGHAFLAPAYLTSYAWQPEGKLLVSVAADPAAAKSRLEQLAKHLRQTGECAPAPEAGTDAIRGKNSFEGRMLARTQGPYVVLLLNPPQNGVQVLKAAAEHLR